MLKVYAETKEPMPSLDEQEIEKIDVYIVYSQSDEIEEYIKKHSQELSENSNVVVNGEFLGLGAGPFHSTALFHDLYDVYVAVKDTGEGILIAHKVISLLSGLRAKNLAKKFRFRFKKPNYELEFCLRKHVTNLDADVAMQKMAVMQDEYRPKDGIRYVEFEFNATSKEWVVENEV